MIGGARNEQFGGIRGLGAPRPRARSCSKSGRRRRVAVPRARETGTATRPRVRVVENGPARGRGTPRCAPWAFLLCALGVSAVNPALVGARGSRKMRGI